MFLEEKDASVWLGAFTVKLYVELRFFFFLPKNCVLLFLFFWGGEGNLGDARTGQCALIQILTCFSVTELKIQ